MKQLMALLGGCVLMAGALVAEDEVELSMDDSAAAGTGAEITITAAPLPKYRVEENDSGTLVPLPPEKVPFVVDTFTEDFIRERNATDLDQLLSLQPGIYQDGKTVMAKNAGTYTIRGYGGCEVTLDGVPLVGGVATFLDPSLLERVDIVKGPVGGAYGGQANSSLNPAGGVGGTVVLSPKRASFKENFYDVQVKGSYSRVSGARLKWTADVNQVLPGENFAIRVPVAYEWREPGWAPSDASHGRMTSVAPSLAFRLEDKLELGVDLLYQYNNQPAYQGIRTLDGKPVMTGWDGTYTETGDRMRFQTHGGTARLTGHLTDNITLRTTASFYQTENRWHYRGPGSSTTFNPANPLSWYEPSAGDRLTRNYYFAQEGIFEFDTWEVAHTAQAGVNVTRKESQGWSWFQSYRPGPLIPAVTTYEDTAQSKIGLNLQDVAEWRGLSLLAGVRADWHDSVQHAHAWSYSPRVGLSYDIAEAGVAILFANVSLTESPNFNYRRYADGATDAGGYLDSSWRAVQKEIGLRVNPIDSLWLTATAFRIDQSNAPLLMSDAYGAGYYADEGKSYSRGFEFSASGNITDRWSLYAAYTYIDYYDKTGAGRFDRWPPHAISLWSSYKLPWFFDAVWGFGGRWRDEWEMTFRGGRAGRQYVVKDLLTFDTSLDIPLGENFTLGLALRNIFDTRGVESARNLQAFANDGRTFELSLRWQL